MGMHGELVVSIMWGLGACSLDGFLVSDQGYASVSLSMCIRGEWVGCVCKNEREKEERDEE